MTKRAGTPIQRPAAPHSKSSKAGNPKPVAMRAGRPDLKMPSRPGKKV